MPVSSSTTKKRQNLRTPGPTPLPEAVREALARDMVVPSDPDFKRTVQACEEGLQWAFQTRNPVLMITTSGSGGLESVVVNTLSAGQKALVTNCGAFGGLFVELTRIYGGEVVELAVPHGQAAEPDRVADLLKADPAIQTVYVTHNETSTGLTNPIKDIAAAVRSVRPEALIAVDGVSSVGAIPIQPDAWDIDVVVSGSQKAWMVPPGLAFVSVSERAWQRVAESTLPRRFFDWQRYRRSLENLGFPATPAVGLYFALEAALRQMQAEGLEQIFERHARIAQCTREGLARIGFGLLADPRYASDSVTATLVPEGLDARSVWSELRDTDNLVLGGGFGDLQSRLLRVGHMGFVTEQDIDEVLESLASVSARGRVAAAAS